MKRTRLLIIFILVFGLMSFKTLFVRAQGTTTTPTAPQSPSITETVTPTMRPTRTLTQTPTITWTPVPSTPTPNTGWSVPLDVSENLTINNRVAGLLMCDSYQNLHIFWGDCATDGETTIMYRNDMGDGLTPPKDIISLPPNCLYQITGIASKDPDTLHLAWLGQNGTGELMYSQAPINNAGSAKAWSEPIRLADYAGNPTMAIDSKGTLHMVYSATNRDALNYDVMHITSTDNGKTWSLPSVIYSTTFPKPTIVRSEMAIDGSDRIYVGLTMRSIRYGLYSELGYIQSNDDGKTWSDYHLIQNKGSAWQGLDWIAPYTFGKDEVHFTWHDPRRLHIYSKDGGKTWSDPDVIIDLGAAFGGMNELTMDSAGVIHAIIGYSDRVYSVPWEGEKWGKPELIDNREFDPHEQHIVTCQGNHLNVVYWDRTGENTVWYSTKILSNAPHVDRLPTPTLTSTLPVKPTATVILSPTLTKPMFPKDLDKSQGGGYISLFGIENGISPIISIGLGLIPAILVVIIILGVVLVKSRK